MAETYTTIRPENSNITVLDDVLPPVLIAELLPSVTEFIEVNGSTVSTLQLKDAGEGPISYTVLGSDLNSMVTLGQVD